MGKDKLKIFVILFLGVLALTFSYPKASLARVGLDDGYPGSQTIMPASDIKIPSANTLVPEDGGPNDQGDGIRETIGRVINKLKIGGWTFILEHDFPSFIRSKAVEFLITELKQVDRGDAVDRNALIDTLGNGGDLAAELLVTELQKNEDEGGYKIGRGNLSVALAKTRTSIAAEFLIAELEKYKEKEVDPSYKARLTIALGITEDPLAVNFLLTELGQAKDGDATGITNLIYALGNTKDTRVTEFLIAELMKNRGENGRDLFHKINAVVFSLDKIEDPRTVEFLITELVERADGGNDPCR